MTLMSPCAWALLRSGAIAAAAVVAGQGVRSLIGASSRRVGRLIWVLHLIPFLTPVLLVGYAYSRFSLTLIHHPAWNQVLYAALVWLKLVPVATLALTFAPSPLSPEAVHCHRLLRRGGRVGRGSALTFWLRGGGRAAGVAFAVVFLFAFGEFEMASLFGIRAWTVALFDAQVGGLPLGESLRLALPPFVCQAALLLAAFWLLFSSRAPVGRPPHHHGGAPRLLQAAAWAYLPVALVAVTVIPTFIVLRGTVRGLALIGETLTLLREVGASVLVAAAAAACAFLAACLFAGVAKRGKGVKLLAAFALCLPGLLGALLVALILLALFQLPGLRVIYDTPMPLAVALFLLLFPFALLLRALLAARRPGECVHAAALVASSPLPWVAREGRRLVWELRHRGHFWVAFLLFCWGYFDLTASSILAPSVMTPVFVRLYNFMHYGQTSLLSTMLCLAFGAPLVVLLLAGLTCRAFRAVAR